MTSSEPLPSRVMDWPADWVDRALTHMRSEECGSPIFALVSDIKPHEVRKWEEVVLPAGEADIPAALADRRWIDYDIQTAGLCCHHHQLIFSPLTPCDAAFQAAVKIERHWHGSNLGWPEMLSGYREYFDMLGDVLGIRHDVNVVETILEEALYPIPFVDEDLPRLFPSLSEGERSHIEQNNRDARTRWPLEARPKPYRLFILGANSD